MNAEKLQKLIDQTRADEQNALVSLGMVLGRRQAYEAMMNEMKAAAAVEKQKRAEQTGEAEA